MSESRIKIKASVNEIYKHFKESPSKYFYIRHYNGDKYYKGNDNELIIFEARIRHNEIGNRSIERSNPYTLVTLEKILSEKVKEFEKEQENYKKEIDKIKVIEGIFAKENDLDANQNVYNIMNECAFILDGIDERNKKNEENGRTKEKYPKWATERNIELIEQWSNLIKGKNKEKEEANNLQKAAEIDELYDLDY